MTIELGHFCVIVALLMAATLGVLAHWGAATGRVRWIDASMTLVTGQLVMIGLGFAALVNAFLSDGLLAGQVFALFVITVAAAEVGIGLAIVLMIFRNRRSANVDEMDLMKW